MRGAGSHIALPVDYARAPLPSYAAPAQYGGSIATDLSWAQFAHVPGTRLHSHSSCRYARPPTPAAHIPRACRACFPKLLKIAPKWAMLIATFVGTVVGAFTPLPHCPTFWLHLAVLSVRRGRGDRGARAVGVRPTSKRVAMVARVG